MESFTEGFGLAVDLELNLDADDRAAIAFGLEPNQRAAVAIKPLAHFPEYISKTSARDFDVDDSQSEGSR